MFQARMLSQNGSLEDRRVTARHKKKEAALTPDSLLLSKIEDLLPLDLLRAVCYTARSIRELLRGFPKPAR